MSSSSPRTGIKSGIKSTGLKAYATVNTISVLTYQGTRLSVRAIRRAFNSLLSRLAQSFNLSMVVCLSVCINVSVVIFFSARTTIQIYEHSYILPLLPSYINIIFIIRNLIKNRKITNLGSCIKKGITNDKESI